MRILVVSICSLALATIAIGAQKDEKKSQPKKHAPTAQHSTQTTGRSAAGGGAGGKKASTATSGGQRTRTDQASKASYQGQKGKKNQTSTAAYNGQNAKKHQNVTATDQRHKAKNNQSGNQVRTGKAAGRNGEISRGTKATDATTATAGGQTAIKGKTPQGKKAQAKVAQNKPLKPQHFNIAKQPNTSKAPPVKFQQGRRIAGSQNWQGQQYTVFRNYKSEWHNQNWWRGHYGNNITFVFGAPYYWRAGYWFPAWGYYPNAYYAWDGPIYAYNRLPPDQVIANVQAALQQQGYYNGEVDGLIGPLTRGAIADYQRDHGLYTTSTIDQPTLRSLGIA
jgi:Putative peptidoglycan binding domain